VLADVPVHPHDTHEERDHVDGGTKPGFASVAQDRASGTIALTQTGGFADQRHRTETGIRLAGADGSHVELTTMATHLTYQLE